MPRRGREMTEKYKLKREEKILYQDLYNNIKEIYLENNELENTTTLTKKLNVFYLKNKNRNDVLKTMLFDFREKRLKKNEKITKDEINNLLNILKEKIDEISC